MSTIDINELDRLTSELASFARSGVPLPEGLAQLHSSLPGGKLKSLSGELSAATAQGQPLSEALKNSSITVPASFAALVRCGEISGDLSGVLDFALKHGRRLKNHRASMMTILIYPLLVLVVMVVILAFTMMVIMPRFTDIYEQLGAQLPGPTQLLVDVSDMFSQGFGILVVLALLAVGGYLLIAAASERLPSRLMAFLPGVRSLVYLSDTSIMTEFVGHLLGRGVPLPEACRAASLVVYNEDMRRSLEKMAVASEQGGTSGDELNSGIPATAAWLYRQGEARGTLADSCAGIARYCENRFEIVSRRTLHLMEPMFILIISVFCGAMVIALYLPLFNIPKIMGH